MTFEELADFLESKMSMSHVYQPLLIRTLVDAGGAATLRQLAQAFVLQDESQLLFYEKRIKDMPVKVLSSHRVVERDGDFVSLTTELRTLEQKARIRMLCEMKLQEFIQRRGLGIWDYRLLETDPVPDDLRYQALKASGGRCALCGATKNEQPLDVDHIIPRSRGGENVLENLQVLCAKCNRTKGNKDETDFRRDLTPDTDATCVFCSSERQAEGVATNGSVFAVKDKHPVSPGHHLVLPKRHTADYFSMTTQERREAEELLRMLRNKIVAEDESVVAFNVGTNCGEVAGQTVMHAHIHLIPRRKGDTPKPRGGVRGVIPAKMSY
jgi:ATP adenylyltransferase